MSVTLSTGIGTDDEVLDPWVMPVIESPRAGDDGDDDGDFDEDDFDDDFDDDFEEEEDFDDDLPEDLDENDLRHV